MNATMNPTTLAEINAFDYWQRTDLGAEAVARILGADHVAWVRAQPHPAGVCASRAAGAWQANDKYNYCAYRSLAAGAL